MDSIAAKKKEDPLAGGFHRGGFNEQWRVRSTSTTTIALLATPRDQRIDMKERKRKKK